jgi:small subunit ribosomal protein S11
MASNVNQLRARITSIFNQATKPLEAASQRTADSTITVTSTMNNVHVVVSNVDGQVVSKFSGGMVGQKHRQRAGPVAAEAAGLQASKKAYEAGHRVSHLHLKGPSRSRGMVMRGISGGGLRICDIRDITPQPTNGCRPKATRRLFSSWCGGAAGEPAGAGELA